MTIFLHEGSAAVEQLSVCSPALGNSQEDGRNTECDSRVKAALLLLLLLLFLLFDLGVG